MLPLPGPEKPRESVGCATEFNERSMSNIRRGLDSRLSLFTIKAYEITQV
jgi:hypothetical protein